MKNAMPMPNVAMMCHPNATTMHPLDVAMTYNMYVARMYNADMAMKYNADADMEPLRPQRKDKGGCPNRLRHQQGLRSLTK
jgi:hypothetical protein